MAVNSTNIQAIVIPTYLHHFELDGNADVTPLDGPIFAVDENGDLTPTDHGTLDDFFEVNDDNEITPKL